MSSETRNLYFVNSNGDYRLLSPNVTEETAHTLIQCFLDGHNFKSYYTRSWDNDRGTMFDVGSHYEFFLWGNVQRGKE